MIATGHFIHVRQVGDFWTELRWHDAGVNYRAWSGADFSELPGSCAVGFEDRSHLFTLWRASETVEERQAHPARGGLFPESDPPPVLPLPTPCRARRQAALDYQIVGAKRFPPACWRCWTCVRHDRGGGSAAAAGDARSRRIAGGTRPLGTARFATTAAGAALSVESSSPAFVMNFRRRTLLVGLGLGWGAWRIAAHRPAPTLSRSHHDAAHPHVYLVGRERES